MKVQCLCSAKISSETAVLHHFQYKPWGPLIVLGIFYSQVIKVVFFHFQNSWLYPNSFVYLFFFVTCKDLIPWVWKVTLFIFIRLGGCLKEGKKICKHLGSNFVVFFMVIEWSHSWISYGFSENLKAILLIEYTVNVHNLFSVLIPSLASWFFLTSPYVKGAPCISHHCFLIKQVEASSHTTVNEING